MENTENRNKIVGERVKAIRERFDVKQKELAKILGYSGNAPDRAVFMIEHGQRGLTAKKMQILVDKYGINPEYLLLRSDYMTYEDMKDDLNEKYGGQREALETLVDVAALSAGYKLEYEHIDDYRLRYHFKNSKKKEWVFSDDEINDYLQEIREYAVFKFEQMIKKKLPDSMKEGGADNG